MLALAAVAQSLGVFYVKELQIGAGEHGLVGGMPYPLVQTP